MAANPPDSPANSPAVSPSSLTRSAAPSSNQTLAASSPTTRSPNSSALVETRELTKRYGSFTALNQVSLTVPRGQVLGLLGPNGAGKSTLIRLLVGATQPTSGNAQVLGMDCWRERDRVHERVAYLPGDARLPKRMRGEEVLRFFAGLRGSSPARSIELGKRLELDLSRRVGAMSTGMRQKLALAVVLASGCDLVILDEPTANLDPTVRNTVLDLVRSAQASGATVIFSSHVLTEIEQGCDRVVIVKQGALVFDSPVSDIIEQHQISGELLTESTPFPNLAVPLTQTATTSPSTVVQTDSVLAAGAVRLVTRHLEALLPWIAAQRWRDLKIERVGLQQLYCQWHPNAVLGANLARPSFSLGDPAVSQPPGASVPETETETEATR